MSERNPNHEWEVDAPLKLGAFVERIDTRRGGVDTAVLDAAAARIFQAFETDGVEALLLKGAALADLLYVAGERRPYRDVDLLVSPRDLTRAGATLTGLGFRNASQALGIDDIGGVVHEQNWVGSHPGAKHEVLIELHHRMACSEAPPQSGWDALAARRTWVELGGHRVPVLDRQGQAMHLALHAAQHGPGYVKGVSELALGLERWPFEVWEAAAALATEIEAREFFAAGLRLDPAGAALAIRLGLPANPDLDWEIRNLDARPRGVFHLRALTDAQGLRERASVVRRALLPSRQWIVWQHPWARGGTARLVLGYGVHILRAPAWAVRAWRFSRRSRRAA
jgi:hypothetical protein